MGAAQQLLDDFLSKSTDSVLVRGLAVASNKTVRDVTIKAASSMTAAAVASSKAEDLFAKLDAVIGAAKADGVLTGVVKCFGDLAGSLGKASVLKGVETCEKLYTHSSHEVQKAASCAVAAALCAAIKAGTITAAEEPTAMLTAALEKMAAANAPEESMSAAATIGAATGALGSAALLEHKVAEKVAATMETKSKTAVHARESATLALGMLCATLGYKFEPYSIPLLPKMVAAIVDKDKKVADAAPIACRDFFEGLSVLSVKQVLGALYEGMGVVGGGGRSKIECMILVGILARRAPRTMGPCLSECIPLVMECLNDSNAKVQAGAEDALEELVKCVVNAEISTTLKTWIMDALKKPDKTLECIDEVLMTTFCNPMDGAALAFTVPILVRGIKDANYELVKKATTCTSNLCALIKESSDVAPFVPLLMPLLEQNKEHSSPDVRKSTETAIQKLIDGAGDMVDPAARPKAIAQVVEAGVKAKFADAPAPVLTYLGSTAAAMLEEKLGGVVRVQYFEDALGECADWIVRNVAGAVEADAAKIDDAAKGVSADAVAKFKDLLSETAKKILADSGDKDFAVDIQNIILAFAGRVLLRKADIRFERGHRYGLIGQNGTGKTTLLNRLAAKDITGFPTELRTFYIRHEVLCDDGVLVKSFLKMHAPEKKRSDADIEEVLTYVEFPEAEKDSEVNSLSVSFRMKLSVAISILHEPELLLLDEPTNHCDPTAIAWLANHLASLEGVTMAVVSHDYDFIDKVCTDITHYDNNGVLGTPCRFVYYPMTFGQFQKYKPEIAAGLPRHDGAPAGGPGSEAGSKDGASEKAASEDGSLNDAMDKLSTTGSEESKSSKASSKEVSATIAKVEEMIAQGLIRPFRMPDPGKPDGIRTFRKPILTLKDASFKYEGSDKYILQKVTASLTLGSRAVIIGGNGSGKSTLLQLLIGDLEAEEGTGEVWKHHNLRLSYVAQQSMHHLEDHLQSNPIQYIQQRFREGLDKDIGKLKTLAITDEDKEAMKELGAVNEIVGRQTRGRDLWYEVKKTGRGGTDQETKFFPLSEIESMFKPYVKKLIKNFDMKQQALDSGMAIRPLTAAEVLKHLDDFGIDSQLAHGKIRQMSGGQRQRLVICAAFWSKPHVIALDEPTNYLDNDSVAALTKALKDFKGAVVTVSENEAFVAEISNEKFEVKDAGVTVTQLRDAKAR